MALSYNLCIFIAVCHYITLLIEMTAHLTDQFGCFSPCRTCLLF